MKFRRKNAFTPWNSANLCDTPWKFQSHKPRTMEILHYIVFLKHPWNFYFFFNWSLEFPHFFFEIPRNSMSNTPAPAQWVGNSIADWLIHVITVKREWAISFFIHIYRVRVWTNKFFKTTLERTIVWLINLLEFNLRQFNPSEKKW